MFKITTQTDAGITTLKLDGKLTSPWIEELDRYWQDMPGSQRKRTLVDLTGVTFIGPEGKTILARMWRQGARFRAAGCLNTSILEEIMGVGRAESRI
ncbi:MAG: STAS domain-containing protein [Nitrospiraceae bacterium]